jgi:pentapeptide MXKDX repeat protein
MRIRFPVLTAAVLVSASLFGPAFAQTMSQQQTAPMSKDTMGHSSMSSDSAMAQDKAMSHGTPNGASNHDTMGPGAMAHDTMSPGAMGHETPAKTGQGT